MFVSDSRVLVCENQNEKTDEVNQTNKMVAFSEGTLIHLLKELSISRSKILSLSSWLIHYKKYYKEVVNIWFEQFLKAQDDHKVTLLYLLNEVVQNGKKCPEYVSEFGAILPKAFEHLSSLQTYGDKLDKDVIKLLKIWNARGVFNPKQIILLSKLLDTSKVLKYAAVSPSIELEDINFEDINELTMLSPSIVDNKTEEEELTKEIVQKLNLLKMPPTFDAKIRGEIGNFPKELFDLETLKNIKSKRSAVELMKRVDYAVKLTNNYNVRLQHEMVVRRNLDFQLNAFTYAQKEMIFRSKERLKKYRMKLIRIKRLQRQMQFYIQKLPYLPDCSESHLPSAGDLFK